MPKPVVGKLGKLPQKVDERTLKLARYLVPAQLPPLPKTVAWQNKIQPHRWPMYANDRYGDCVLAGAGHAIHTWTANSRIQAQVITEQQVLAAYSELTGFNPNDPSTDNGTVMLDALNYWRNTGIGGHKIEAFVQINPQSKNEVKYALDLFGVAYLGVRLPISAQSQSYWHKVPGRNSEPNSWGGHCVIAVGYTPRRVQVVTWGLVVEMTWGFFLKYVEEAYAILTPDWWNDLGIAPNGFKMDQLRDDLSKITSAA